MYQSPTTGMFPHDLSQPGCVESHVRDSIYCATAIWALSQAFKLVLQILRRIPLRFRNPRSIALHTAVVWYPARFHLMARNKFTLKQMLKYLCKPDLHHMTLACEQDLYMGKKSHVSTLRPGIVYNRNVMEEHKFVMIDGHLSSEMLRCS